MGTFNWSGTGFVGHSFVPSQFFQDANNVLYYFDQNYKGFFPVTLVNNVPQYNADGQISNLPANTTLTSIDNLISHAGSIGSTVINSRFNTFNTNPSNIINAITQNPTSLVSNAVAEALKSNQNLQTAIQTAAPLLGSPQLNFGLQDAIQNWPGGQELVQNLLGLASNHQQNITQAQDKVQHLTDFKQKLVKQITKRADEIRGVQGQIQTTLGHGTFTALASSFPTVFNPIQSMLGNQNTMLNGELANLLPIGNIGSGVSSIVDGIINSVLGGSVGQIVNPIDKITNDLQHLLGNGNEILNQIPINGFTDLASQTSAINQVTGLLNNIVALIPVVADKPIPSAISDVQQILNLATNYKNTPGFLGQQAPPPVSTTTILASATAAGISVVPPPAVPDDSSQGGTFNTIPSIAQVAPVALPGIPIPTVGIQQSTDPQIANQQNQTTNAQTKANQPGTPPNTNPGDCINNINDIPLKPRNSPLDGSLGDYNGSQQIPF